MHTARHEDHGNQPDSEGERRRGAVFFYKQMTQEIGSIETNMEMIAQMCVQQSHIGAGWMAERLGQETQGQELRVERTAFPMFDGDQDKWADFRRIFKGML